MKLCYQGKRFRVVEKPIGEGHFFSVIEHPGAVVILPLLTSDTLLLIRNFRYTIDRTLIELPAGTLETREEPLACALRELEEETGYKAGKISPLFSFYSSPGISNEMMYIFVAEDLEKSQQHLDAHEKIEVLPVSIATIPTMIQQGEIVDAKSIASLLYFLSIGRGK